MSKLLKTPLKISFFQYCPIYNNLQINLENITQLLEINQVEIHNSDLIILPEYCLCGSLSLNDFEDYKKQFSDLDILEKLQMLSQKYPTTTFVFGSLYLPQDNNWYNTSLAICDGKVLCQYSKKALIYNENYICKSNDQYPIFEVIPKSLKNPHLEGVPQSGGGTVKVGLAICWDLILPEVFRHYTKKVDLVIITALWGIGGNPLQTQYSHSLEKTYYRQLLTARAYENAFATIFVNSVGKYQSPHYSDRMMGGSVVVIPPMGEVFFTNSKKPNEIQVLTLDFEHLTKYKEFYATDQDYFYYQSKNIF